MWINEVAPERLAELFHHYHQALMPEISGKGSEGRGSWREVPQQEKSRLVAAARLALLELESMTSEPGKVAAVFCPAGRSGMGLLSGVRARFIGHFSEACNYANQASFRLYEFLTNSLKHSYA